MVEKVSEDDGELNDWKEYIRFLIASHCQDKDQPTSTGQTFEVG